MTVTLSKDKSKRIAGEIFQNRPLDYRVTSGQLKYDMTLIGEGRIGLGDWRYKANISACLEDGVRKVSINWSFNNLRLSLGGVLHFGGLFEQAFQYAELFAKMLNPVQVSEPVHSNADKDSIIKCIQKIEEMVEEDFHEERGGVRTLRKNLEKYFSSD